MMTIFEEKCLVVLSEVLVTKGEYARILESLEQLRADSNRRFEEHLTEIRKLREDSNRRFDAHTSEIRKLREDFNKLREDSNRRFEAHTRRFDYLISKIDMYSGIVGRLQTRTGKGLEDAVYGAMNLILGIENVESGNIHLRKKLLTNWVFLEKRVKVMSLTSM